MKKYIVGAILLLSTHVGADVVYDGYLRAGYQYQEEGELALGGKIHLQANPFRCTTLHLSSYFTQGIDKKYNDGVNFFGSQENSYAILGEAYIETMVQNTEIKLGRQEIDTPYLDTDDVGMVPNTFEALTLYNSSFKDTTIFGGFVQKMAGVDANVAERFTDIADVYSVGVVNQSLENITLQGWFYDIEDEAQLSYFELDYERGFSNFELSLAGQYSLQDYDNSTSVDIYGSSFQVAFAPYGVALHIAYNTTSSDKNQIADNFFGGGPFFVNAEHLTLADAHGNADAYHYGIDIEPIENLTLSLSYLDEKGDESDNEEIDFLINYQLNNHLSWNFIYSDVTDNIQKENDFSNLRLFINYTL